MISSRKVSLHIVLSLDNDAAARSAAGAAIEFAALGAGVTHEMSRDFAAAFSAAGRLISHGQGEPVQRLSCVIDSRRGEVRLQLAAADGSSLRSVPATPPGAWKAISRRVSVLQWKPAHAHGAKKVGRVRSPVSLLMVQKTSAVEAGAAGSRSRRK